MNQSVFVVPTTGKICGSVAFFACISFLLVLAGCGSNVSVTANSVPSPTVTITANPASITAGGTSTLTVVAANATQVTVTGTDGSSYAMPAAGGTKVVTPSANVTYTAVATGVAGKTPASASATVLVAASQAQAPTVSIVANPSTVATGGASTLTVVATNATQVTLTGTDGSSYTLSATGGSHAVNPTATTIYTAVATGPGGTAKATAQVTVASAPTVTITANPTSIASGSSSMLTVTAANATQVTLTGTDGSRYVLGATGGAQSVSPTATTTYTATATGTGGSATGTVQVMVVAAPTLTIVANPATIASGSSSTLTVTATNATQVTVTGPSGSFSLSATGGTLQVSPTATATYTATATGTGGTTKKSATVTVTAAPAPTVTLAANPTSIASGGSSTLTVTATNATQVTVTGSDNSSYTLSPTGGTQTVSPASTTNYTATATGTGGTVSSAPVIVTVNPVGSELAITHVIFMLQENHTFDNYFGMLNPYRNANGWGGTYTVDGIDDKLSTIVNYSDPPPGSPSGTQGTPYNLFKLTSSCIDDETSSWLESYGDVNRYDFSTTRSINMDGFVHTAENYAKNCMANNGVGCAGTFTQATGQRAMGYYDEGFLNYYYYMASQFAISDRWFSPVSSKSIDNRIATFTGGTTQGLVFDPGNDDGLPQLQIPTIFQELQTAGVSWKIYYTVSIAGCPAGAPCPASTPGSPYPATNFSSLSDSYTYLYQNPTGAACTGTTQPSSVVGDPTNSFCIDTNHIAPLSQYYTDLNNNALPSFAFIEAGYGVNDEHPGSGQEMLAGQLEVSKVIGAFMGSPEWKNSVFFLSYDEGGGPYDHVPPVPGSSNKNTDASLGTIPDISTIAVNPDKYNPCVPAGGKPTTHCDLNSNDPGANSADAAYQYGFAAQLGFRVPNMVISPFTRQHYVSHIPMDHTAVIKFVENRFIGPTANLTKRDAAQPNLLDFFDFTNIPWATPPTPPAPVTDATFGKNTCTPASFGP